ncbi:MAG: Flp pilus assembly complex ATPase component TadA [Rhodocyclaceae bacterium]|jgi:MSHA biogenesis protein MshE|nr:Flp pilus assembly complex ATPase component TadA [Rhodocyclaceae bacterium]
MARPEKFRLGEILVQQNLLSQDQLQAALDEQKKTGRKLGRVFVDKGFVTEEQISEAIARQINAPYINLKYFNIKPAMVRLLPEAQARRFRALVLEQRDNAVRVGFADPTDLFAYDEVARILKRDIDIAVVTESQLLEAVDRVYQRTEEISGLAKELTAELGEGAVDLGALALTPGLEEAPVVKLLQSVFEAATQVRASDIHIEPQERSLVIRFRIDGVMHVQTEADMKIATALVLRLKLMSGLDISEKRLPQDGRFNVKVKNIAIDVRISTMPTQHGESVVMRLLNQGAGMLRLEHLGMPPPILERLRLAVHRSSGMVLVTGPTGSGKTTTLYAALAEINTTEKKIITVEDPVEYRLPGINQVQVNDKIELSFERVLRSALRQDPDVILVGEMRDQTTAEIGLRAAMTGHMVLSTLHTNDAASTPIRLLDMGVPRYMVAMSLHIVIAQRLLRTLCERCARPRRLTPQEHEWLRVEIGDEVDRHEYREGAGCSHCNGTGFLGRTGIYEMLEMSAPVVEAANREDPAEFIRAAREQMAHHTLRRDAIRTVIEGRTTVHEAMRTTSQYEE